MRILRRPQLIELDKLEPGTCFLFGSAGATDLGIIVQINPNQRGFLVPGPKNLSLNGLPVVLHAHEFLDEFVIALPDALIRLPSDVDSIIPISGSNKIHPEALIATQDGLLVQAVYRHSNLYSFDVFSGQVKMRAKEGFAYNSWDIVEPTVDDGYKLIKSFGRSSK